MASKLSGDHIQLPAGGDDDRPAGSMYYDTAGGGAIRLKNQTQWVTVGGAIGSSGNPATNMSQVPSDGFYYFTDGANNWQAYVKKNWHLSRDWMIVLKTHNRGDIPSGSSYWTNATVYNESDSNISSGTWAKYGSWNHQSFNYVLMDMNGTVPAIMYFSTARTMYNAMQNNSGAAGYAGLGCNSTSPSLPNNVRYQDSSFYYSGGPFGSQTGSEAYVQMYGTNTFGNNATNGNPDNAGLSSVGRAGARVGCPLDNGGHSFNNATNSGADSGFGFGYCAGNSKRTGSCGYAEWNSSAVVEISPGRLWVS